MPPILPSAIFNLQGTQRLIGFMALPDDKGFRAMHLRKKKDEVQVLEPWSFDTQQKLIAHLQKYPAIPLAAWINDTMTVQKTLSVETEDLVLGVLGVQVENKKAFISQEFPLSHEQKQVCLIRKDKLADILEPFETLKSRLIYLFFSQKGLIQPDTLEWGSSLDFIPLYSAVSHYFLTHGKDIRGWEDGDVIRQILDRKTLGTRILAVGAIVWMLFVLVGLSFGGIINYQSDQARQIIQQNNERLDRLATYEEKIQQHKSFLTQSQGESMARSRASFYLDRIAALAPKGLIFNQWMYRPKTDALKRISLELAQGEMDIFMTGAARDAHAISHFSRSVQELGFIHETQIWETQYDFRNAMHQFTLLIRLKHE